MGGEHALEPVARVGRAKRVVYEQVRGGARNLRHRSNGFADFFESAGKAFRIAGEPYRGRVGKILAIAANRHLHHLRHNRRENRRENHNRKVHERELTAAAPSRASPATELPHSAAKNEFANYHDRADERRGDAHYQDVAVINVRKFVREHAFELLAVHARQKAGRDADRGVPLVPARRESVRRFLVHHVNARYVRQPGGEAQPFDGVHEVWKLGFVNFTSAHHAQHGFVAVVPRVHSHYNRDYEREKRGEYGGVAAYGEPDNGAEQRDEKDENGDEADCAPTVRRNLILEERIHAGIISARTLFQQGAMGELC